MNPLEKNKECSSCGTLSERNDEQCQICGGSISRDTGPDRGREGMSTTVKVYTGIFVAWALIFPFLLPIILKLSRDFSY